MENYLPLEVMVYFCCSECGTSIGVAVYPSAIFPFLPLEYLAEGWSYNQGQHQKNLKLLCPECIGQGCGFKVEE